MTRSPGSRPAVDVHRLLDSTIPKLFLSQATRRAAAPLFWFRREGRYHPITWQTASETVQALGCFFLTQQVAAGDRIIILCESRPEWGMADVAVQSVGAWTVPVYPSLTPPEIQTILLDAEPVGCIVSTAEQARKVLACRQAAPSIRFVLVIDHDAQCPQGPVSWAHALQQGREAAAQHAATWREGLERGQPDDLATLIYTSGTTGEPKGVQLSHRNFLSNVAACLRAVHVDDADVHLGFLPLCHVFERMAGLYLMLAAGAQIAYAESMDTIPQNMQQMRPTVMLGVPRFFEKLYARVQASLAAASPVKRRLARWAFAVGRRVNTRRVAGRGVPLALRLQHWLADRLVLSKFRHRLGGRLRFFISGSAPLSKTIGEFFYDAGILILEGYGLTETSPVITVNRPNALKFGTVGQPLEGILVRIADDGEILTKGPHVMRGYYRKPEATNAAIVDGWFHTGDIGHVDQDGFLAITDRKKDLIKTAGGKYVAPQKLESLFITDAYVAQALVFGDKERYCVALIVPNFARLTEYAKSQSWPCATPKALVESAEVQAFMWNRINALQRDLASYEQIKHIALLEQEFSQAAGELTPTLKAKRAAIAARYHDVLRRLYETPRA